MSSSSFSRRVFSASRRPWRRPLSWRRWEFWDSSEVTWALRPCSSSVAARSFSTAIASCACVSTARPREKYDHSPYLWSYHNLLYTRCPRGWFWQAINVMWHFQHLLRNMYRGTQCNKDTDNVWPIGYTTKINGPLSIQFAATICLSNLNTLQASVSTLILTL